MGAGRLASLLAVVLAIRVGGGCGGDEPSADPTVPAEAERLKVVDGRTGIDLSDRVDTTLRERGIEARAIPPASGARGDVVVRVESGLIQPDTFAGVIDHGSGGVRFERDGGSAVLRGLVVSTEDGYMSAEEVPAGTIARLDLSGARVEREGDRVTASGVVARLDGEAPRVLNSRLGVDAFRNGMRLGTLTMRVRVEPGR